MNWKVPVLNRKWLAMPLLLLGLSVAGLLAFSRRGPQRIAKQEEVRSVRVIIVQAVDVVPRVIGYGTAEPALLWRAVSEVPGRVKEVHHQLKPGAMVRQGEILLRIDTKEYELAIARIKADMAQVGAQLEELTVKQANDQISLEIEEASLVLAQRDLQRVQRLVEQNAVSKTEVDNQQRAVLAQRQVVQRLRNLIKLVPQQKKSLEAALEVKKANLAQAELDLAKTVIKAPFDCRLGNVKIEPGQFLIANQSLFEAHGTAYTEVETQVPLDRLRTLIDPEHTVPFPISMDAESVQKLLDFQVTVRFYSGDFHAEWEARVVRMREQLDPRTRTIGLVVEVEKPYEKVISGQRPPLVQGMFCEVILLGKARQAQIVIPRSALHDGHVYLVGADNRLRRRKVEVAFAQSKFLCLRNGLQVGETLVVSDPTPAIEGLLTNPVTDERLQQRLWAEATGKESLK